MKKFMSLALAGLLASAAGLGAARADTPAPAEKAAKAVAPLTDEGLGAMLENMGYEYKAEKQEKTVIYTVKIDHDGWTYFLDVSLSGDKDQLWISSAAADVPADGKVPAEKLLQLLAETNDIGPAAVYYDTKFKKIKVALPLLNHGGVTPAVFRTYLSDFLKDEAAVQKLCDFPKTDDKAEAKKGEDKAADEK